MRLLLFATFFLLSLVPSFSQKVNHTNKQSIINHVDRNYKNLTTLSDSIWSFEEIAFQETKSAAALMTYAEANGMKVTKNIGDIPTAFIAEYGSGKPIIGVLGEFDALPGLSQNTVPYKSPLNEGKPGHGCGHNLFGTASMGAAIAVKDLIKAGKLKGTVRFYGTPAEEKFFGKLWMIRSGAFDDVDAIVDWHPSSQTKIGVQKGLALVDFIVEYFGQAAHASSDPWNGRSAGDAAELFTTGINFYREHVKPTVRIHYHIQDAGKVVNVVPDYARVWTRVRDTRRAGMEKVWKRVEQIAKGAATMSDTEVKISLVSGVHEVLINRTGSAAMQKNIELLGPITYTDEEQTYAKGIQKATGKPEIGIVSKIEPMEETLEHPAGGSTDVGDVSWVVPVMRLSATTAPNGTPWHSWAVVACGGMSIGHKGMAYAAKTLGMTMVDLFENEQLRKDIKAEFKRKKGDYIYKALIPEGPPPIGKE